ncbi:MAG: hypothetical protein Q7T74_03795 [Candidatus Saccharibacteria bacterium]|nr:hypothetical protein [Candidatus Saccharibacteria bacterium]
MVTEEKDYDIKKHFKGSMLFHKSGARYSLESFNDYQDAMAIENVNDIYVWNLDINIVQVNKNRQYEKLKDIDIQFSVDAYNRGIEVAVYHLKFSEAKKVIDEIAKILDAKYFTEIELDPDEELTKKLVKKRENSIEKIITIFNKLPEYQARITKELSSEKDVQNFLYPILKSHFSGLQEEDYLQKVAGSASKPDFGIDDLGIAIEVKYTSKSKSLKKIADEIAIDSRKYFGKTSPYCALLVLIYNGSQEPTPANYIQDLIAVDVIESVNITPKILPRQ